MTSSWSLEHEDIPV